MREKTRAAQEERAADRGELWAGDRGELWAWLADGGGAACARWGFPPAGPLHPEQAMASATRQAGRIRVRWHQVSMQRCVRRDLRTPEMLRIVSLSLQPPQASPWFSRWS
jgi:hypothetical protein